MTLARAVVVVLSMIGLVAPAVRAQTAPHGARPLAPRPTLERLTDLMARDALAEADLLATSALAEHPDDPLLHNLAGVVAARRHEPATAAAHFEAAIRLDPQSPAAYENLGRLYQEQSADDPAARGRAIATYARLLEVVPAHVEAAYQSGLLLALDGRCTESLVMLDRLPQEIAARPPVLAVRAAASVGCGQAEAARAAVAALVAHPELAEADVLMVLPSLASAEGEAMAIVMLEGLDRRSLASVRTLETLASLLGRAGRVADARQALERAVRLEGPSVPLLLALARTALVVQDRDGALGYLAHARALEPSNARVHFLFGMVCVEQNLVREAFESLQRAVELAPDDALINYAMGAVATHRHEPSESLPYFETYVRLRPDDPRGYFALGAALFYSNLFDKARPHLERAARSEETATGAHLFLGRIARQTNDLATARREIEQALARDDRLADAWAELGLIQTRLEQYVEADASLARALAIDPDHYAASLNLATLYGRTRDPRRTEQAARVATLLQQREARSREFLRIIKVVPDGP